MTLKDELEFGFEKYGSSYTPTLILRCVRDHIMGIDLSKEQIKLAVAEVIYHLPNGRRRCSPYACEKAIVQEVIQVILESLE